MAHRGELGDTAGEAFEVRQRVWTEWILLMLVVGAAGAVVAGIVAFVAEGRHRAPLIVLGAALLLCLAALLAAALRHRASWRITQFVKGLEIKGPGAATAVAFSEIAALGLAVKDEFVNGKFSGTSRRLQLWREQDPPQRPYVDLHTFCKVDTAAGARLAALIDRLVDEAMARIEQVLAKGGTVKGVGLQLSPTALRLGAAALPLETITATGLYGGKLCLWVGDEAEPRHRLDPSLPNALPIVRVVQGRIDARVRPEGEGLPGLGRVLFERRSSRVLAYLLIMLGVSTAWLGVGIVLVLFGLHLLRFRFRCHERGVYYRGLFKRQELLYRDLASFTFAAVRQYYNGGYVGTSIKMEFVPDPAPGRKPIRFSRLIRNADQDLEVLRDQVARRLATKLLARLARQGEIPWSPNAIITPTVLRYRPAKFIGKGEWTDLPLTEVAGTSMDQGILHVFAKGRVKAVLSLPVGAPNFFPGLHAFAHLSAAAAKG